MFCTIVARFASKFNVSEMSHPSTAQLVGSPLSPPALLP